MALHHKALLFLIQIILLISYGMASSKRLPEASSTLLKMHQLYVRQPPHDTSLYDILEVSPNATAAEIAKSYRKLSRRLHPDKKKDAAGELAKVRAAYDILKHDSTRLPYHRHGLLNTMDAVYILTGSIRGSGIDHDGDGAKHAIQMELLELMGYDNHKKNKPQPPQRNDFHSASSSDSKRNRIQYIAISLLERLRPVLDGTLPEHVFLDHWMHQCDRWKSLPLGAQIVRCIGRAYRYSGERFLRKGFPLAGVQDNVRGVVRQAKYFANAAVAGGRVVLEERKRKIATTQQQEMIETQPLLPHWEDIDEHELAAPSGESIRRDERDKAHKAVLESLQVEALWKICKIDLDRTIRTACGLLLDGEALSNRDGWVGDGGNAIVAHNGRLKLASLLVRMGNIMVHRSKEGTAWME